MAEDGDAVLTELISSKADVEDILKSDPNNPEFLQVLQDLQAAIKTAQDACNDSGTSADRGMAQQLAQEASQTVPKVVVNSEYTCIQQFTIGQGEHGSSNEDGTATATEQKYVSRKDEEPNFAQLAHRYPELEPHVTVGPSGRGSIDFRSFEAARQLTRALLHAQYGLHWWVPDGHLIPPVTNRANYIHWLHDLLPLCPESSNVRVLDVGCGANLIYPLLGSSMHGWAFVSTDITDVAITWAHSNLRANSHLEPLIEVRNVASTKPGDTSAGILLPAIHEGERFTFTMCNPPFFESMEEAGRNPATAFSGTAEEMTCPGGELAFVMQMVRDSTRLQGDVAWFTTMVGKKATLRRAREALHAAGVPALRTTEFVQGRTSRWGLAWSYAAEHGAQPLPRPAIARSVPKWQTSFSVVVSRAAAPKVLSVVSAALEAQGGQVTTDVAASSLTALMNLPEALSERADDAGSVSHEHHAVTGDAAGVGPDGISEVQQGSGALVPDEQRAGEGEESPAGKERAAKRQRLDDVPPSGSRSDGDAVGVSSRRHVTEARETYNVRVRVFQEASNKVAVSASIAACEPRAIAEQFTQILKAVQMDVAHILS
ncbi:g4879 [Coccomyxa elongata]